MSTTDVFGVEAGAQKSGDAAGGNQIAAGQGLLSDVVNGVQTLSLDPAAAGAGQWVPLVVYAFGGGIAQWSPSIGISSTVTYGANGGSATEGGYDWPLARASRAGKVTFRIEYTDDSDISLRLRRRRADTDSWARFENNLVQYRAASVRNNSNLPAWGAWQTGNPVPLVAAPTWTWYEVECTTLLDDEIGFHLAPQNGVVSIGYMRIYVKI